MVLHYVGDWGTAWTEQDKNTIKNQKSKIRNKNVTWDLMAKTAHKIREYNPNPPAFPFP